MKICPENIDLGIGSGWKFVNDAVPSQKLPMPFLLKHP